jgi:cysteine desulfurase/selenocysteine lyase
MQFDIQKIRSDFPTLSQEVHKKPLVYFDNGATTQKPQVVIDRVNNYYQNENSNVHRGVHHLSQLATAAHENARVTVQKFIGAAKAHEVIFTKGTTESINLVAHSLGKKYIQEGDEILISTMEHHANIVPWQMVCEEKGATLKVIPITDDGEIELDVYQSMLNERTKIVSFTHISNALGSIQDAKEMVRMAHEVGAKVLVDGAQAVSHLAVDVQDLDCDFYVFSGHKIFAPMGVGVVYGKEKWLEEMPPYQTGGEMIKIVTFEKTTFNDLPHKFESGTPNVGGILGLEAAIQYVNQLGLDKIAAYEHELLEYATEHMQAIEGLKIYGNAKQKASLISFVLEDIHHFDAGTIIDHMGIALRTGHHCTQPLMQRFDISGTIRPAFSFYNTKEEIDLLIKAINQVKLMFS